MSAPSMTEARVETRIEAQARVRGIRRWKLSLAQVWVVLALLAPAIVSLQIPLNIGDSAYQIRAGEIMLKTQTLIRTDPFTFTSGGQPWTNQQWGDGILFALLHRAGGWELLVLTLALLVASTFALVYLACRASGARVGTSAWLTLGSFLVALGYAPGLLSLRPQTFGFLLFALTMWILARRRRHPGGVWAIPALVLLWANLHATFFLAFLLLGLAWLEERSDGRGARLLTVGVVALACSFLNPFGPGVWGFALDISSNPEVREFGGEWAAPTIRSPSGVAFFLSAAVVGVFLARRRRPLPWPALLRIGAFFAFGLLAVRGVTWWGLAMAPTMAALVPSGDGSNERDRHVLHTAIAAFLVILAVASLPWRGSRGGQADLLANAPAGITAALDRVLQPGDRIFNEVSWGSWFELRFPRNPVFIDGRLEVFGSSVWDQYAAVRVGLEGWQSILDRWRVTAVAIDPDRIPGLLPLISSDPGWRMIHQDSEGVVFVRSEGAAG